METLTISQLAQRLHDANNIYKNELIEDFSFDIQVRDTLEDLTTHITDMLNAELDFRPVATFITRTTNSITLHQPYPQVINELQRVFDIACSEEHIALYKSLNLDHDGADDFDFGGTYYHLPINLLKAIQ